MFTETSWFCHWRFAVENFPPHKTFPEADSLSVSLIGSPSKHMLAPGGIGTVKFKPQLLPVYNYSSSLQDTQFSPESSLRLCIHSTDLFPTRVMPRASCSICQSICPPTSCLLHPCFSPLSWRLEASVLKEHSLAKMPYVIGPFLSQFQVIAFLKLCTAHLSVKQDFKIIIILRLSLLS